MAKQHKKKAPKTPTPQIEIQAYVIQDGDVPKYPYGNSPQILHRLTTSEVTAIACEFGTCWGVGEPWVPDEPFWTVLRFKLINEYGLKDGDLPSLTISAICELFRYSYVCDLRATKEGPARSQEVRTSRGHMQFHKDSAELLRKRREIGYSVADLMRRPGVAPHWEEQIAILLKSLSEYDRSWEGNDDGREKDWMNDPWPFRWVFRLLDLPRERPAAYVLLASCHSALGGKDIVSETACKLKMKWGGLRWQTLFGNTPVLDIYLNDVEADLREKGLETPQAEGKPKKWKPPKGYTGAKSADVPRSTLEGWEQQDAVSGGGLHDKVKRDSSTREKYYPNFWLKKRKANYTPRKRSP
jgi:hypothetical protein